jgi:hypothetical protein
LSSPLLSSQFLAPGRLCSSHSTLPSSVPSTPHIRHRQGSDKSSIRAHGAKI